MCCNKTHHGVGDDGIIPPTWEDGDTVTYAYDNSGALASIFDSATGRTTRYYYDFTDRLMKYAVTGANYSHSVEYKYDATNKLLALEEIVNGTVLTTSYEYDKDNRVTSVTTNGVTETYTYDRYGRVTVKETKQGSFRVLTETYTYETHNGYPTTRIASMEVRNGSNVLLHRYTYAYDGKGNITSSITEDGSTTTYVYDSANQLTRENNQAAGKTWTWTYDNAGNILEKKEYAYTTGELGEPLDTVTYTYGDSTWGDLLTAYDGQSITYDEIGNPLTDGTWSYVWEHGRQLAQIAGDDVYGANTDTSVSYTYDADGMRTGKTVTQEHSYSTQTVTATCTQQGYTLYTCACGDSYKDNFVEVQEHNYGLNGDEPYCLWCGEPRGDVIIPPITPVDPPISQFAFTPSISVHLNATETATYHYTYNGGLLTQMELVSERRILGTPTTQTHVLTFTYDANGNPQTVDYDDFTYYYVVNLQGDIVALTDTTGDVVVSYTYDAWGNILETSGDLATTLGKHNPLRYRGYVYDQETGLYYLQSRYYNPTLGRFLNADALVSTGQGLLGNNMFAYCLNNPAIAIDSQGGFCKTIFGDTFDILENPYHYGRGSGGATVYARASAPTSFCAYEEEVEFEEGKTTKAEIMAGKFGFCSATENGISLVCFELTAFSLDFYTDEFKLDFFDLGELVVDVGFSQEGPYIDISASVWSPSLSFKVNNATIEVGANIIAAGITHKLTGKKVKFGASDIAGIFISLS